MRNVDQSYQYYGWLFDMLDQEDPITSLARLANLINPFLDADEQINPASEGPRQFEEFAYKLLFDGFPYIAGESRELNNFVDQDFQVTPGFGSGGGGLPNGPDTLYRLREGIERFLITDINNPAASAKAQSEVYIMWDNLSTGAENFNHVPGGSNVLYMDGHCEFIKFPGKQPVTPNVAILAGALSGTG
jgi:prepilin-type processing-associated H-X9-DG protein